jgi:hypothetical protein
MMSLANLARHLKQAIENGAYDALSEVGREWSSERDRNVSDWSGKPRFTYVVVTDDDKTVLELRVTGDNADKWIWVDQGTATGREERPTTAYPIRPKRAGGVLRFQTGYSARTRPIARAGVGSGTASGEWVSRQEVMHPGIAARKFTAQYADDNKERIKQQIADAIKRRLR